MHTGYEIPADNTSYVTEQFLLWAATLSPSAKLMSETLIGSN